VIEPLEPLFSVKLLIVGPPERAKLPKELEPPIDKLEEELTAKKFELGVKFAPSVNVLDDTLRLPAVSIKFPFMVTSLARVTLFELLIVVLEFAGCPEPINWAETPL
jgi:hypothetical protein